MLKSRNSTDGNCEIVDSSGENANSNVPRDPSVSNDSIDRVLSRTVQNGENGLNNNHDGENSRLEMETEPSSVEIEVIEDLCNDELLALHLLDEMTTEETTLDDGGDNSSRDDGMISSPASSSSGSVASVSRAGHVDRANLGNAAAAADQPEVADFLDMDFDVEPTSTDDEEDRSKSPVDKKEQTKENVLRSENENGFGPSGDGSVDFGHEKNSNCCRVDHGDCLDSFSCEPSTSSTAPKFDLNVSNMESSQCVSGCQACAVGNAPSPNRWKVRLTSKRFLKAPILGELPPTSISPSTSTSFPLGVSVVTHGPLTFCHYQSRTPQASNRQPSYSVQQPGPWPINVGGPTGLLLARSAYVGFPTTSRPANGAASAGGDGQLNSGTYRIWTIEEAENFQATQIGPSMCGATALINVFRALGIESTGPGFVNAVSRTVPTRPRANNAPIAEYLLSRSVAGTDAEDLIESATSFTNSRVLGRFFPMTENTISSQYDAERFGRWLLDWLKKGAVPVLTLNMQRGLLPVEPMPDAWHHQMVFGVCTKTGGVYLTNPLECVPLWFLKHALCSPSVLLVKSEDVRQRWHGRSADLSGLLGASTSQTAVDSRPVESTLWTGVNVLGQVARALRQSENRNNSEPILTHVAIPARYRSGVTLYARGDTETWTAICNAPSVDDALHGAPPVASRGDQNCDDQEASSVIITVDECVGGASPRPNVGEGDTNEPFQDEIRNEEQGETNCVVI